MMMRIYVFIKEEVPSGEGEKKQSYIAKYTGEIPQNGTCKIDRYNFTISTYENMERLVEGLTEKIRCRFDPRRGELIMPIYLTTQSFPPDEPIKENNTITPEYNRKTKEWKVIKYRFFTDEELKNLCQKLAKKLNLSAYNSLVFDTDH